MLKYPLKKFLKYCKKTYQVEKLLKGLTDTRKGAMFKTSEIVIPVLLGFLFRIDSFNELNYMLKDKRFKQLIHPTMRTAQIDATINTLKRIDNSVLSKMLGSIVKKSVRNKAYRDGTIDGYVVAAVDGTKLFGSTNKSCEHCLSSSLKNGKTYYSHYASFMYLVGEGARQVLDFELYNGMQKSKEKDEGEIKASKRLLEKVNKKHKGLVDVIVYDGYGSKVEWINECTKKGIEVIFKVGKHKERAIKEVKARTNKSESIEEWFDAKKEVEVKVYEGEFELDGVEKKLRYIKFEEKYTKTNRRKQMLIATTGEDINVKTLYKMMKARWEIENSLFHKSKTYLGLDHCYVHNRNAMEAIIYLMCISENLMQLYLYQKLQVVKQYKIPTKQVIELMKVEWNRIAKNQEYLINTT